MYHSSSESSYSTKVATPIASLWCFWLLVLGREWLSWPDSSSLSVPGLACRFRFFPRSDRVRRIGSWISPLPFISSINLSVSSGVSCFQYVLPSCQCWRSVLRSAKGLDARLRFLNGMHHLVAHNNLDPIILGNSSYQIFETYKRQK